MNKDDATGGSPAQVEPGAAPAADRPECVLAVDDEHVIRLLLSKVFASAGLANVIVGTTQEALQHLKTRRFDLLLTDKNLPDGNGVDLAHSAREIEPNIGVVLMTGYASAESADALFKLGIDDYLVKPFDLEVLLRRINEVRELRRLGSGLRRLPAVALRRVMVVVNDPAFRARVALALGQLGCQALLPASVSEGLRATPPPDAIVAAASLVSQDDKREVFRLRTRQPGLRVCVVGEPTSLEDTMTAIGLAAHQRISRTLDQPALLALLAEVLRVNQK